MLLSRDHRQPNRWPTKPPVYRPLPRHTPPHAADCRTLADRRYLASPAGSRGTRIDSIGLRGFTCPTSHTICSLLSLAIACKPPALSRQMPRLVAEHLVESNLAGHDSHGVLRVPQYVGVMRSGEVNVKAEVTVERVAPGGAIVDGGGGLGQVAARRATEAAIEMARTTGIAAATVRIVTTPAGSAATLSWSPPTTWSASPWSTRAEADNWSLRSADWRGGYRPIRFRSPRRASRFRSCSTWLRASRRKENSARWLSNNCPCRKAGSSTRGNPTTNVRNFYDPPFGAVADGGRRGT